MGKIGFFEGLSILIGILWLFGLLRVFVIPIKTQQESKAVSEQSKKSETIASEKYASDADFIDYEEVD